MARIAGSRYTSGRVNEFRPARNPRNGRKYDVVSAGAGKDKSRR